MHRTSKAVLPDAMSQNLPSTSNALERSRFRRFGLIFWITAGVFAVTGIRSIVRAYGDESENSDLSISVLQFSLAVVFFALGVSCYARARAEQAASREGHPPE